MSITTIQLSEDTRERLKEYKVGGMTYEDVLKLFMELLEPEEFHAVYRKWQKRVAKDLLSALRKWTQP